MQLWSSKENLEEQEELVEEEETNPIIKNGERRIKVVEIMLDLVVNLKN